MNKLIALGVVVSGLFLTVNLFSQCCPSTAKKTELKKAVKTEKVEAKKDAAVSDKIVKCDKTGKYFKVCPKTGKKVEVSKDELAKINKGETVITCPETGKCFKVCPKSGKNVEVCPKTGKALKKK